MLQRYRALGWATGLTGAEARQKAKDIRFMQKVRQKHHMQVGVKSNKLQRGTFQTVPR